MFLARRRAFARHPLCRVLEEKKGREERNGREVVEKREREKKKKKKKKNKTKQQKKKHKQINFEQNNILSLYVNRVGKR